MKKLFIIFLFGFLVTSCGKKGPPGCELSKSNKDKQIRIPSFCN